MTTTTAAALTATLRPHTHADHRRRSFEILDVTDGRTFRLPYRSGQFRAERVDVGATYVMVFLHRIRKDGQLSRGTGSLIDVTPAGLRAHADLADECGDVELAGEFRVLADAIDATITHHVPVRPR